MTIYIISHRIGKTIAEQVPKAPSVGYAIRIGSHIPEVLHPFVLWTETMPRHGSGVLQVKGDSMKALVALFAKTGQVQVFTDTSKFDVTLDAHFLTEVRDRTILVDAAYRFGQNCVQRRYNVRAHPVKDLEAPELR